MSTAYIDLTFSIQLPEDVVDDLVGRIDDDSQEWTEDAQVAVEDAIASDPLQFMEYAVSEDAEVML